MENSLKFLYKIVELCVLSRSVADKERVVDAIELGKEFDKSVIFITKICEDRDRIFDPKVKLFPKNWPRKYEGDVKNI